MLASLVCKVIGHKVDRRRVWNDGIDFRTVCKRCEAQLLRGDQRWRRFNPERDEHPHREPHPRDRD